MASSFAEVVCIGVAKTGKAAEGEDVADGLQAGCCTKVQIPDLAKFQITPASPATPATPGTRQGARLVFGSFFGIIWLYL